MKKAVYIVGGISLAGIVLLPLESLPDANDYFSGMGVLAFAGAALSIGLGILLVLISLGSEKVRPYGLACLLTAGVLLLCGFTLCSNTHAHIGHM